MSMRSDLLSFREISRYHNCIVIFHNWRLIACISKVIMIGCCRNFNIVHSLEMNRKTRNAFFHMIKSITNHMHMCTWGFLFVYVCVWTHWMSLTVTISDSSETEKKIDFPRKTFSHSSLKQNKKSKSKHKIQTQSWKYFLFPKLLEKGWV